MNSLSSSAGVVVLGFPRSGTTLLRRLLESHHDLCCPPETHLL
jgi:protein-tyrosine sulfotransferase